MTWILTHGYQSAQAADGGAMTTQDVRLASGEREVGRLRQSATPHMGARDIEVVVSRPSEREHNCIYFDDLAQTLRDAQLRRVDELTEHPQQLCNESFGRLVAIVRQLLGFGH
jgi:hypothetical protein